MNVSGVTNHFPTAQEGFATTTSGSVSSGAASVGLNSVAGYTNGDVVAFVIEPGVVGKEQVFTGTVNTTGSQVDSVEWTEGTNQSHTAGVTVADYVTATHMGMVSKGLEVSLNQDGTLKDDLIGWENLKDGMVLQKVSASDSDVSTGTTTIPLDDTIPQNTEGDEYLTVSITPKSTASILVIEVMAMVSNTAITQQIGALFQDTDADALTAATTRISGGTAVEALSFKHVMTAGTTSATTFKFRSGGSGAGTTTFNGTGGSRRFSTLAKSFMVITEYKA